MKTFTEKVYDVVGRIPKGSTLTYQEVARRAGNGKASRAVGNIMNKNPFADPRNPIRYVPCHRVIRSDGSAGGYARGTRAKIALLKKEGAL